MSSVPRHSEEELRQQWAFLDALVDRQASSLRAGSQDPEEEDLAPVVAAPETSYLEEISTLTRRVSTLEGERFTLLRRLDLAEEARMAAEEAREAAEAAQVAAEHALATARADADGARIAQGLPAVAEPADADAASDVADTPAVWLEPAADAPAVLTPVAATEQAAATTSGVPAPVEVAPPVEVAQPVEVPAPVEVAPPSGPTVAVPQKTAVAPRGPGKPRRKTWWQRLRG